MPFLRKIVVQILTWEAQITLWRYRPKIIAVSGNVGKTMTADAISAAIRGQRVRTSAQNEPNTPLTILGLEGGDTPWRWLVNIVKGAYVAAYAPDYPEWLVLEIGADRPGTIRRIARWLRPDVVVITSIPDLPVHVEFFSSPAALAREKAQLAAHLKPDGILIIDGDDALTREILEKHRAQAVSYGLEGSNAFVATDAGIQYEEKRPVGMHFYCEHSGTKLSVSLRGGLGIPRVYAALAALAVAETVGVPLEIAADALGRWVPPPGRMRLLEGIKGSLIIDDSYDSSPAAAHAAIDTLKNIHGFKKKIAVLGDMLELGKYSKDAHVAVGKHAAKAAKQLVTVGFRARAIAESALGGLADTQVREYDQNESARAGKELEPDLDNQTVVLIKGSESMRMEKTVEEIMAEPMRKEELLVRQDADWKMR